MIDRKQSSNRLRVGVVGVGHLGKIHARLWKERQDVDVRGIFDIDPERAAAVGSELGLRCADSLPELLSAVDAIPIATPTSTHAAIAEMALRNRVHCFIEKPITARYEESILLIGIATELGLTIQVGHVERFNPAVLALAGRTVVPMFIESHRLAQFTPRATDVAVVLDLMIHDIDLAHYLVRSSVKEVHASGVAVVSDTIDIANARLVFENGCVANLTASRISQRPMRKMRLFQRDAYISLDFAKPSVEIFRISDDRVRHSDAMRRCLVGDALFDPSREAERSLPSDRRQTNQESP